MRAADLLVSEGYAKLGYRYVIVDDCWLAKNRSADGKLVADKNRFPNGIKALSDYVSIVLHRCSLYGITINSGFTPVICALFALRSDRQWRSYHLRD